MERSFRRREGGKYAGLDCWGLLGSGQRLLEMSNIDNAVSLVLA